ncbi:uncharacterized protein GGS22DRAFT_188736 [Annulohypoxylon maeteangense]|uniref:uncharacterized protein n=1 Tax=Annulohypoxylon maeteangense TaxID=1927788 RepID=UPI002008543C|nr:uncharacterized protein GGS22DRAFT_188736 [Annulohypoxylon maeteangense]KAI0884524.1 hypothetical protein GGS22DRAFT_188736 [Annulohypoxylon maeteangense]
MSNPLRPLLPNSPNPPRPETSLQSQHRPKRIATPAACEACRRRKSKCSAERPRCSVCIERQTPCEYTTLPTETHLRAQKRKLSGLEIRCQAYEDLVGILRSRPEEEIAHVIQRLRTGENVQAIVKTVQDGDLLLQLSFKPELRFRYEFPYNREMPHHLKESQNPYIQSLLYERTVTQTVQPPMYIETLRDISDESQKMYLAPYHTVEFHDSRISSISVSKWTAVSSDNPMLRMLLQIYFIFEFPSHSCFHKDYFLEDMFVGINRFCSPLLVNSILAIASVHGYTRMKNRAEYWQPDNLAYRFLSEALRLFELEQANPTITTIQAAAIISMAHNFNGVDELGWGYTHKSLEMARRMSLFSTSLDESTEWQVVAGVTAWCLFNLQALATFHTFKLPIIIDPPNRPLPDADEEPAYYGEILVKYPLGQEPIRVHYGSMFKAVSQFRIILNEITKASFSFSRTYSPISLEAAIRFRSRLLTWYEDLPEPLQARHIVLPCHLKIHIHYHILLISLFEPHLQIDDVHDGVDPGMIVAHSKNCFETLIRVYYLRHGFESLDTALVQFLHLLGFSALRDSSATENDPATREAVRSTLMLCAKGLWEQGQNYYLSEAIFRMFRQSMSTEDVATLREIIEVDDGHGPLNLMAQELRSRWPIGIFSMTDYNKDCTLDHFTHWWQQYLQERPQEVSSMEQDGSIVPPRYPQHYDIGARKSREEISK